MAVMGSCGCSGVFVAVTGQMSHFFLRKSLCAGFTGQIDVTIALKDCFPWISKTVALSEHESYHGLLTCVHGSWQCVTFDHLNTKYIKNNSRARSTKYITSHKFGRFRKTGAVTQTGHFHLYSLVHPSPMRVLKKIPSVRVQLVLWSYFFFFFWESIALTGAWRSVFLKNVIF